MIPDLKPEMEELIQNISLKNMYSGNRIPASIMAQFQIVEDESHIGILVPFWLSVLQYGRGKRRSTKSSGLWKSMYRWMEKRNMFESTDVQGRVREAKALTWYINKYGNKQFRNKVYVDIYDTEVRRTIEKIDKKFDAEISRITSDLL